MTGPAFELRLLGPVALFRNGLKRPLPASRKLRALLAYLAVTPAAVTRSRLCELLWDGPSDPRAELRWCLSKLRGVLDDPQRRRIEAQGDAVRLDLSDCFVDATRLSRRTQPGVGNLELRELRDLQALFRGDFAEGLEFDRDPQFANWLGAQRRSYRALQVAVLEQLVAKLGDSDPRESFEYLERWLQLTPFDGRAHRALLDNLLRCGRVQEAEEHLATAIRLFDEEGVNWIPIREAWKAARHRLPEGPGTASVNLLSSGGNAIVVDGPAATAARRVSICVMPFVDRSAAETPHGGIADGLTEDIITRLAKLRVLFVIARGSVYALGERNIPPDEAARLLNVDYVASGSVRRHKDRVAVTVELADARLNRIVWVDDFSYKLSDALEALDEIGNRIVASIAGEIEAAERNRAILKPPGSLDAWEAYHRGLWHMYRFNRDDNGQAAHYFRAALRQDRSFARAHAGLSFTHFQNAFLQLTPDRDREIELAYETASHSLDADERDPAAHWAMGRALWLRGSQEEALVELEDSVKLSPNFALGHYTLGFVHGQSGDAQLGIASTDHSRNLSPFDPLLFAMLATRAIALARLGQYDAAAGWALKAATRPNAHVHIQAVAASCLAAAGRFDEARGFVASLRRAMPGYRLNDLLQAFRFAPEAATLFRQCAARIGLD